MSAPEPEAGPRWLSAEQLAAWRGLVNLMQKLPAALDAQLQQDAQLSFVEYHVLVLLADEAGPGMRMSRLAVLANVEQSRLSHLVARLEKRGILRREPDPDDGRCTNAVLTVAGHDVLAAAAPGHVGRVRELLVDVLDRDELRALHRSALKVTDRIEGGPERRDDP